MRISIEQIEREMERYEDVSHHEHLDFNCINYELFREILEYLKFRYKFRMAYIELFSEIESATNKE